MAIDSQPISASLLAESIGKDLSADGIGSQPVSCYNLACALSIEAGDAGIGKRPVSALNLRDAIENAPARPGRDLSSYTWPELSEMGEKYRGTGELDYLVGQTKDATIDGLGTFPFRLIGIEQDYVSNGSVTAPLTFQCAEVVTKRDPNYNTIGGSWKDCNLRGWVKNNVYNNLQSDLKPLVRYVSKMSNAYTSVSAIATSYETKDYVFIASRNEVGCGGMDVSGGDPGKAVGVYEYWSSHNSSSYRIMSYKGAASEWALRSTNLMESSPTVAIREDSISSSGDYQIYTSVESGVVPCFCI